MDYKNREIGEMQTQLVASQAELERIKAQRVTTQARIEEIQSNNNTDDIVRQCDLVKLNCDQIKGETQNHQNEVQSEKDKKIEIIAKIKELNRILGKFSLNASPPGLPCTGFSLTPTEKTFHKKL